jgi:hypothetical protein
VHRRPKTIGAWLITAVLALQFAGCGTLLHPERRGQRGGNLDAGIVVLDAIGLLFFIIPGVIAFAVDFSNGTIYLPSGPKRSSRANEVRRVGFDPGRGRAGIEAVIEQETGMCVALEGAQVSELSSMDQVMARFDGQAVE